MPRMSLELVVVAIVILVVALVVLTIFGGGITPFATMANAKSTCASAGKTSCEAAQGAKPFNWDLEDIKQPDGTFTSCKKLVGDFTSGCCKPATTPQNTVTYTWGC